jgi:hypothetical protein
VRLEALGLLGGLPVAALRAQVAAAFQVVLHLRRNGSVRELEEVCLLRRSGPRGSHRPAGLAHRRRPWPGRGRPGPPAPPRAVWRAGLIQRMSARWAGAVAAGASGMGPVGLGRAEHRLCLGCGVAGAQLVARRASRAAAAATRAESLELLACAAATTCAPRHCAAARPSRPRPRPARPCGATDQRPHGRAPGRSARPVGAAAGGTVAIGPRRTCPRCRPAHVGGVAALPALGGAGVGPPRRRQCHRRPAAHADRAGLRGARRRPPARRARLDRPPRRRPRDDECPQGTVACLDRPSRRRP